MSLNKIRTISLVFCLLCSAVITAQEQPILTPVQYFELVSEKFGKIQDYQADITIKMDDSEIEWKGNLIYKSPNKLRIDYKEPNEQVLVFNGERLMFYRPEYSTVFEQTIKNRSDSSAVLMAGSRELSLLKENFNIGYLIGPDPVPLDEDSDEMVVKLKFSANTTTEGFKELEIAFSLDGFYRRVTGRTHNQTWTIEFTKVVINPGIPDPRFEYEPPANANVYTDFLYGAME